MFTVGGSRARLFQERKALVSILVGIRAFLFFLFSTSAGSCCQHIGQDLLLVNLTRSWGGKIKAGIRSQDIQGRSVMRGPKWNGDGVPEAHDVGVRNSFA